MYQFLSTTDVARILGLSSRAVRDLAHRGILPVAAQTESGIRLFDRSAVVLLKRQREGKDQGGDD